MSSTVDSPADKNGSDVCVAHALNKRDGGFTTLLKTCLHKLLPMSFMCAIGALLLVAAIPVLLHFLIPAQIGLKDIASLALTMSFVMAVIEAIVIYWLGIKISYRCFQESLPFSYTRRETILCTGIIIAVSCVLFLIVNEILMLITFGLMNLGSVNLHGGFFEPGTPLTSELLTLMPMPIGFLIADIVLGSAGMVASIGRLYNSHLLYVALGAITVLGSSFILLHCFDVQVYSTGLMSVHCLKWYGVMLLSSIIGYIIYWIAARNLAFSE